MDIEIIEEYIKKLLIKRPNDAKWITFKLCKKFNLEEQFIEHIVEYTLNNYQNSETFKKLARNNYKTME